MFRNPFKYMFRKREIHPFDMGQLVASPYVAKHVEQDPEFVAELETIIERFQACDWGELCHRKAWNSNNDSLAGLNDDDSVVGAYDTKYGELRVTTILSQKETLLAFPIEL